MAKAKKKTPSRPVGKFTNVGLSMNIGGFGGDRSDCNPGGSYICTTGTKGCDAGLTCVGTSGTFGCFGGSEIFDLGIDARINVQQKELKAMQAELQRVVAKFSKR